MHHTPAAPATSTPIFTTGNLIDHLLRRALPHLSAEELRWIAVHGQEEAAMHVNNAATAAEHIACTIASDETGNAIGDHHTISAILFTLAHAVKTSLALHDAAVAADNHLR